MTENIKYKSVSISVTKTVEIMVDTRKQNDSMCISSGSYRGPAKRKWIPEEHKVKFSYQMNTTHQS